MDKYIIIKTSGIYGDIKSSAEHSLNISKKIAEALIDSFNFTYNQFLFPYIDALAVKGKNEPRFTMHFDTIIAKADNLDENRFKGYIKSIGEAGVLWRFSDKQQLFPFENIHIYTPYQYRSNSINKFQEDVFLFEFGVKLNNDLFRLPDYKIRGFSGKLCAFFEISAREIIRLGGTILYIGDDRIVFLSSKNNRQMIYNRLFELYNEKLNNAYNFTNSFFDEIYNI